MPHPAPVVIIDGVDECSDEQLQRRMLTVIGNAVKNCRVPLHFLISNRPEALIEETLNEFQDFTLHVDLAVLDDSNRDIEKYLVDQFSVIASKQGLDPTDGLVKRICVQTLGELYICISVKGYSAESQLDIIRNLKLRGTMLPFALLNELYLEILQRQRDQDFLKTFLLYC